MAYKVAERADKLYSNWEATLDLPPMYRGHNIQDDLLLPHDMRLASSVSQLVKDIQEPSVTAAFVPEDDKDMRKLLKNIPPTDPELIRDPYKARNKLFSEGHPDRVLTYFEQYIEEHVRDSLSEENKKLLEVWQKKEKERTYAIAEGFDADELMMEWVFMTGKAPANFFHADSHLSTEESYSITSVDGGPGSFYISQDDVHGTLGDDGWSLSISANAEHGIYQLHNGGIASHKSMPLELEPDPRKFGLHCGPEFEGVRSLVRWRINKPSKQTE